MLCFFGLKKVHLEVTAFLLAVDLSVFLTLQLPLSAVRPTVPFITTTLHLHLDSVDNSHKVMQSLYTEEIYAVRTRNSIHMCIFLDFPPYACSQ